tara:strand:+ start:5981 stop:6292 length:312 start_codon:yes stop_codon:yes gene_type:complete
MVKIMLLVTLESVAVAAAPVPPPPENVIPGAKRYPVPGLFTTMALMAPSSITAVAVGLLPNVSSGAVKDIVGGLVYPLPPLVMETDSIPFEVSVEVRVRLAVP